MPFSRVGIAGAMAAAALLMLSLPGSAADEALTPVGAMRAGNAAGTIPAWTGGMDRTPPGIVRFRPGIEYPDPFASEKPERVITSANMMVYAAHLTPGEQALLGRYPDYRIAVYPTHRTVVFPAGFERASRENGQDRRVALAADGNGIVGTTNGVPFPAPVNGLQAIWNALTRYRGERYETENQLAAVTASGAYQPVTLRFRLCFVYGAQTLSAAQRDHNMLGYFLEQTLAPPRLAGSVLLVHETLDQVAEPRRAWTYSPGTQRVRLAPEVAYDNPGLNSDGLRTDDDLGLFNGATDRFVWTLLGKREIYVPYNDYGLIDHRLTLRSLLTPRHINTTYTRYELHRVWVVEARLKPGYSHIYSRRRFYLDEDSWIPLLDEEYDNYGILWRVGETHPIQLWNVPRPFSVLEVLTDLESGRYLASRIYLNSDRLYRETDDTVAAFTPQRLREIGFR